MVNVDEQSEPLAERVPLGPVPGSYEKAQVGRRVTAAFIDGCVALLLFFALGLLGATRAFAFLRSGLLFWVLPVVYILARDAYWRGRPLGIGKRLAKLHILTSRGKNPDLVGSVQRNILFFFPPVAVCMAGLELYLLVRSKEHERFGDHFGDSIVVRSETREDA